MILNLSHLRHRVIFKDSYLIDDHTINCINMCLYDLDKYGNY